MTHLTPAQFVDAAEGALSADLTRHLEQCESCQERVTELRGVLSETVRAAGVPEPSPLFWEHLSRRVHDAVAVEPVSVRSAWWQGLWRPLVALGAVAAALALVVVVRHHGTTQVHPVTESAQAGTAAGELASEDESVEVVSALAGDLSFDELRAANLVPSGAVVDRAVSSLSPAQQRELIRLVREGMGSE